MASLPSRQQPQRRSSPEERSEASHTAVPVRTRSAHSEDSQTLFLNSPKEEGQQTQSPEQPTAQGAQGGNGDEEVRKCWICFADSTEDTPETSPWRDPCPCALVAHEECLLDWIADMEAPNRNRSQSIHAPKIECPQCKSEIKLSRPRSLVVDAVRGFERVSAQLTTPGALSLLAGTLYNESMLFGVHSIYAVFGSADGFRILRPLLYNTVRTPVEINGAPPGQLARRAFRVLSDHMVHWRLYAGVPLIGPMLVLSRANIADSVLPVLPVLFFATKMHSPDEVLDFAAWPPSASLAFAVLPYLRQVYNTAFKRLFAEKEKQWLREIQPRVGQGQGDGAGNDGNADQEAPAEGGEDGNMFEVRIDGGIWEEWEDEEEVPQNQPAPPPQQQPQDQQEQPAPDQQDGAADPPNIADDRANDADANPQQPPQQQQPQPNHPRQQQDAPAAAPERRLSFSPTALASSVLGALLFPSIAGMTGELLKLVLPRTWTHAPVTWNGLGFRSTTKGILQEKWGRSLVGGCLFVVLKDAIMLYVRWKMARMHRERRVVDFEGGRGRGR